MFYSQINMVVHFCSTNLSSPIKWSSGSRSRSTNCSSSNNNNSNSYKVMINNRTSTSYNSMAIYSYNISNTNFYNRWVIRAVYTVKLSNRFAVKDLATDRQAL